MFLGDFLHLSCLLINVCSLLDCNCGSLGLPDPCSADLDYPGSLATAKKVRMITVVINCDIFIVFKSNLNLIFYNLCKT